MLFVGCTKIEKDVILRFARTTKSIFPTSAPMYMCSLHQTSEDELTKVFSKYGSVNSVNLKQKETITFAFVEFGSTSEAEEAINE